MQCGVGLAGIGWFEKTVWAADGRGWTQIERRFVGARGIPPFRACNADGKAVFVWHFVASDLRHPNRGRISGGLTVTQNRRQDIPPGIPSLRRPVHEEDDGAIADAIIDVAGAEGGIFRRQAPGSHRHVTPDERGMQHGNDGDSQSEAFQHILILPAGATPLTTGCPQASRLRPSARKRPSETSGPRWRVARVNRPACARCSRAWLRFRCPDRKTRW